MYNFCTWIDTFIQDMQVPDVLVTSRLNMLLLEKANNWYTNKRELVGQKDWTYLKEEIHTKFGTPLWKNNKRKLFNNDKLDLTKHEVVNWCLKQSKRLKCFVRHLTQTEINTRILELTSGPLEINIKARLGTNLESELIHYKK